MLSFKWNGRRLGAAWDCLAYVDGGIHDSRRPATDMSRSDYAILTLRGFALLAWFHALEFFGTRMMEILLVRASTLQEPIKLPALYYLIPFVEPVIFGALGTLLFVYSVPLASRLMPAPEKAEELPLPPHPIGAASIVFAAVGVAIFFHALPPLLNPILIQLYGSDYGFTHPDHLRGSQIAPMISAGLQLVLGFFLFLKARVFATAWWGRQRPKPQ